MQKNFIIPLAVYPFDVMVSIGETDAELKKRLSRYGIEDDDACLFERPTVRARCVMYEGNQTLIRLRKKPVTNTEYGELQHEIFHAATFIMDRIGMKLVLLKSDEAYAYLVQYLTEKIYDRL